MTTQYGHFITLEGGEGTGKTTLLNGIYDVLIKKGLEVIKTREPGGTLLGEKIRSLTLHRSSISIKATSELLLFLAARAQHIEEVILPALKAGKYVLCDRFNDSTIAYQGAGRELGVEYVKQLCKLICKGVTPRLTFFLNLPPEIGLKRSLQTDKPEAPNGEFDRVESEHRVFHQKVKQAFEQLAQEEPLRIYEIDASASPAEVLQESIQIMEKLLLIPNR